MQTRRPHPTQSPTDAADNPHARTEQAINRAIRAGYRVGRRVRIGHVPGRIIGYNIGQLGRFRGSAYPLVVRTEFGIAKCSLRELEQAWEAEDDEGSSGQGGGGWSWGGE
ncbi:MAG: hypothetical protein ACK4KV_14950 [Rhodocyclaceae bacterium]